MLEDKSGDLIQSLSPIFNSAIKLCSGGGGGAGRHLTRVSGASRSFFVAQYIRQHGGRAFCLVDTMQTALALQQDFHSILGDAFLVNILDTWGSLAYTPVETSSDAFSKRATTLCDVAFSIDSAITIVTQRALLTPVPPVEHIRKQCLTLHPSDTIDTSTILATLQKIGYYKVPRVAVEGEFSLRGEVFDIFTHASSFATRVTFDFDKILHIKAFDPITQNTVATKDKLVITPTREVTWNDELLLRLTDVLQKVETPATKAICDKMVADIEKKGCAAGEELFYPVLWEHKNSVLDYAGDSPVFVFDAERLAGAASNIVRETMGMYKRLHLQYPCYLPKDILFDYDILLKSAKRSIFFCAFDKTTADDEYITRETKDASLKNKAATLEGEAAELGDNTTMLGKNAATSEDRTTGQGERVATLGNGTAKQNNKMVEQDDKTTELGGEATRLDERAAELGEKVATLEDETTTLRNGATGQGERTATLGDRTTKQNNKIARLDDKTTVLGEKTATLGKNNEAGQNILIARQGGAASDDAKSARDYIAQTDSISLGIEPSNSYFGNVKLLKDDLRNLTKEGYKIFIYADNYNQALRIREFVKEEGAQEEGADETKACDNIAVLPFGISEGFVSAQARVKVVAENEIFSRKKNVARALIKNGGKQAKSEVLDTFVELSPGDFVVHVNYGIGKFISIDRIKAAGHERDYVKLEYADKEFVFVPIEQVNLVQRYIGREDTEPKLDKIGSKSWSARKAKVRAAVAELADHLIHLYAKRQTTKGFACKVEGDWDMLFEAAFPYEDTADQVTATQDIRQDMCSTVPMDRLLCGDVGFGKTEVAMRAAFLAVMNGKQVAFLCPTTILVEQHYDTLIKRFDGFPVKIRKLSRFVAAQEVRSTIQAAHNGTVDIIVGTHRVIQKDVIFRNLGLLIVDEEQRFGVKDKERLKGIKANIDCLSMSATPIPRTLHMSILKIRDISLLTTPPQNRQAVQTVVSEYSDEIVARAILRETQRGGQVFYLHNRIETLEETKYTLQRLLPQLSVECAHGREDSDALDDTFRRFKMGGFHVLVATTIIENGIDIPNVNTIIIDRADMYGISQLYQLRGRVGRSSTQAYAYLLYKEGKVLNELAMKRLQAISDFTALGSGFKIAMKDMELRGAGNLLGRDQSGNLYTVGFDMYVKLLGEAVDTIMRSKDGNTSTPDEEATLELEYTGFIPDTYIRSAQIKMEIYKKIASIYDDTGYTKVYNELSDRFGPLPKEVESLMSLAQIRIMAHILHISSIIEKAGKAEVTFGRVKDISINKVLTLIKTSGGTIKLLPNKPNVIVLATGNVGLQEKADFIKERLEKIV